MKSVIIIALALTLVHAEMYVSDDTVTVEQLRLYAPKLMSLVDDITTYSNTNMQNDIAVFNPYLRILVDDWFPDTTTLLVRQSIDFMKTDLSPELRKVTEAVLSYVVEGSFNSDYYKVSQRLNKFLIEEMPMIGNGFKITVSTYFDMLASPQLKELVQQVISYMTNDFEREYEALDNLKKRMFLTKPKLTRMYRREL